MSVTNSQSTLKKTPCIVMSIKSVPNYQVMYNELTDRKYWGALASGDNPTASIEMEDVRGLEEELRSNTGFLPISYQKIVGASIIATDKNGETTFCSFTGDENFVLEKVWNKIGEYWPSKNNVSPYPVIITNDRKKATIPLLISRSAALYKSLQSSLSKAGYGSIKEVAKDPKFADTKIGKLCRQFAVIRSGMGEILCKNDKWENRRPNYTNPYSNFQPDMAYDYYISSDDLYSTHLTDEMVATNSWDALAYFSISKLLDTYKTYLSGQEIVNNIPCSNEIFALTNKDIRQLMDHEHLAPRYNPSIPAEVISYCRQVRENAVKKSAAVEKAEKQPVEKQELPKEEAQEITPETETPAVPEPEAVEKPKRRRRKEKEPEQEPVSAGMYDASL